MTETHERTPSFAGLVGLVAVGLLLGLVGSVVQAARITVGGVTVPWGLLLTAATVLAVVRAASWTVGSRRAGAAVIAGWLLATTLVLAVSPGGDVLLPDVPRTYAYLVLTGFLGVAAAALPVTRVEPPAPEVAWEGLDGGDGLDGRDSPPPGPADPSGEPDAVR